MEQINRMKVVMICHFSTVEMRSHLPLDDRKLYGLVRKMLGLPAKSTTYGDIAPWDPDIIKFLKNKVELTVISAHSGLKKKVVSFDCQGVNYFFVRCDEATLLKRIVYSDNLWRKLNPMVGRVKKIVDQVKPNIVCLVGAENAYYSSTVLGIQGLPIYVLCQTIYNNPERINYGHVDSKNASTEMEIFRKEKYFGVYCKKHYNLLKEIAPNANIFKFGFPTDGNLLEPSPTKKIYDFVNFAHGMSDKKGYPDAIEAIAIVKNVFPDVKLDLVGAGNGEYDAYLKDLAKKKGVEKNVVFTPFFPDKKDLFCHIQQSRFALLPCKMDNISGTMMQAMQLELPIVVYKTTGTPSFNKEKECALIAEHSNVNDLAAKMLVLMDNPDRAEQLKRNAREYQEKLFRSAKENGNRLIENFKTIIANFNDGTPIIKDQLFNPERDD